MRTRKKIPGKYFIRLLSLCAASILLLSGCGAKAREPAAYKEDNLAYQEDRAFNYREELLRFITVEDGYYIADYGESSGEEFSYSVFRLELSGREENEREMYWEIAVLRNEIVLTVLRVENEEHGSAFPAPSDMVAECDVNFDGENDILLCLGHFGNQGAVSYKCFLAKKGSFSLCAGFAEIANPSVDSLRRVIRSQWRNTAVSHGWGIYRCFGGDRFLMTQRLTNEITFDEAGNSHESWRDEILLNGGWITRELYDDTNSSLESIVRRFNGPASNWGLDQEWWLAEPGKPVNTSESGQTDQPADSQETAPSVEEPSAAEQSPEAYENQLRLLLDHSDEWAVPLQPDYAYAVTDLNQNGRLELISSVMEGSGRYTSSTFYEVDETFDGLTVRERIYEKNKGMMSEADIITEEAAVYYDPLQNSYHYIFLDHIRDGAGLSDYIKHSLTLEEGGITDRVLAYQTVSCLDSTVAVTCEDTDGKEISEEDFNRIADKLYPDCIKMKACFSWFWPSGPEASTEGASELPPEEECTLLGMLSKSCRKFQIY